MNTIRFYSDRSPLPVDYLSRPEKQYLEVTPVQEGNEIQIEIGYVIGFADHVQTQMVRTFILDSTDTKDLITFLSKNIQSLLRTATN